jgi:hypothetical protein
MRTESELSCAGSGLSCTESDRSYADQNCAMSFSNSRPTPHQGAQMGNLLGSSREVPPTVQLKNNSWPHAHRVGPVVRRVSTVVHRIRSVICRSELCEVLQQLSAHISTGCTHVKTAGLEPRNRADCPIEKTGGLMHAESENLSCAPCAGSRLSCAESGRSYTGSGQCEVVRRLSATLLQAVQCKNWLARATRSPADCTFEEIRDLMHTESEPFCSESELPCSDSELSKSES